MRPDGSNPCRGISKYKEVSRERYLSEDELARLGEALKKVEQDEGVNPYVIACIRMCATG